MPEHALYVFDDDHLVGTVFHDGKDDKFRFRYDEAWLASSVSYPLSPCIPLRGEEPGSATVRRFIENLLPEGRALDIAAAYGYLSRSNVFGLILQLGAETTGALRFHAQPQPALEGGVGTLREITPEELNRRIREREHVPFTVWDGRVRMSIAGYQDKLAVYLAGDRMYLADGRGVASTHLLKPEPVNTAAPCMVANEHYCMALARRVGLPVAPVEIRRLPSPVLLVTRFDRVSIGDDVRRLHIVDACQALDLPVSYKYERNLGAGRDVAMIREGVSFEKLFSLPMMLRGPARRTLLQWAVFQFLIGNSDAHGKNISFFCTRYGLEPTPFYDLVSVMQYDGFLHDIAIGIGDVFDYAKVTPYAWADLIERSGVRRATAVKVLARVASAVRDVAREQAASPLYIDEERDMVNAIAAFVERQATLLLEAIPAILDIDPELL